MPPSFDRAAGTPIGCRRRVAIFGLRAVQPRFSAEKILPLALPSRKLRGNSGWGEVKSGENVGKKEAGKSGRREVYGGL
ncbi:hypothetical protein ANAPC5_01389 [Anaplasma phagocytophilum]|nr:hypothetical protein ANAPC5_01389 [Anaplasma phagocytophilum]